MSALPPPFDWSERLQYDWTSQEGLNKLKGIVRLSLKYDLRHVQLYDSGCILNGTDFFVSLLLVTGNRRLYIFLP
jgi:hypothetical protein